MKIFYVPQAESEEQMSSQVWDSFVIVNHETPTTYWCNRLDEEFKQRSFPKNVEGKYYFEIPEKTVNSKLFKLLL